MRGQSLETGYEINLRPNATETSNLVVRTALPLTGINGSSVTVTVDHRTPKDPIATRNVPLVYADAVVASEKLGYLPSYDSNAGTCARGACFDAKKLTVNEIAKSDLSPFHTIIIDNRGYEAIRTDPCQ